MRIAKKDELKTMMQSLHGWSDKLYGEYLNIFIEKWNSIPDDAVADENCAWIARDEDGKLFCYAVKPCKRSGFWIGDNDNIQLPNNWFPEVKWEDEEPKELILKNYE